MTMLKNKNLILLAFLVAFIFALAFLLLNSKPIEVFTSAIPEKTSSQYASFAHTDYIYYQTYGEANKRSDLIFIGETVNVKDEELTTSGTEKRIYTVSDFKVAKVVKGDIKSGDIIRVKQDWISERTEFFKQGERHILFLESYDNEKHKAPASLINPIQGSMKLVNGKTLKRSSWQFINDGIRENDLIKALKNIKSH